MQLATTFDDIKHHVNCIKKRVILIIRIVFFKVFENFNKNLVNSWLCNKYFLSNKIQLKSHVKRNSDTTLHEFTAKYNSVCFDYSCLDMK
jgi:hypothetical protein